MQNSESQPQLVTVNRRLFINRLAVAGTIAVIGTTALGACGDATATTGAASSTPTNVATTTKATTTAVPTTTVAATTTAAVAKSVDGFIDLGAASDFTGSDKAPKQVSLDSIKKGLGDGFVIKSGDSMVVLSSICTHQGCNVAYNAAESSFACPCHGSKFKLNGEVINGPAKLSLARYTTKVDSGRLLVATTPSN